MKFNKSVQKIIQIKDGKSVSLYKKKPSKRQKRRKRAKQVWKDLRKGKRM